MPNWNVHFFGCFQFQFKERKFEDDVSDLVWRQQNRLPKEVVDYLVERLSDKLQHRTARNNPLTPREQVHKQNIQYS